MPELLSVGVENGQTSRKLVNDAQKAILKELDELRKQHGPSQIVLPNRRGSGRTLVVRVEGKRLQIAFCGATGGFRVNRGKLGCLQKSHNRTALERLLEKFLQTHPELQAVLEDYIS